MVQGNRQVGLDRVVAVVFPLPGFVLPAGDKKQVGGASDPVSGVGGIDLFEFFR